MSAEKALAIVLRVVEFSESSYVATLLTADFGKITGLAKGARRPKSAFENALDLLAVSRVVFLRKTSDSMDLLTEARLERRFRAAGRDLRRLYAGYYVLELLLALTDERDPQPDLFRMALQTVIALDGQGQVGDRVLRFELAMLHSLGQLPVVDRCVECGVSIAAGQRVAFGHLSGGALCPRCKVGQRHVVSLSAAAAQLLSSLGAETQAEMALESPIALERQSYDQGSVLSVLSVSGARSGATGELRGLMNYRMQHAMGRRARLSGFLGTHN